MKEEGSMHLLHQLCAVLIVVLLIQRKFLVYLKLVLLQYLGFFAIGKVSKEWNYNYCNSDF